MATISNKIVRPVNTVLVKPVGAFCNIECEYCFYLDKHSLYPGSPSTHKMAEETLKTLIKQAFLASNSPTFLWQGGEPTIMGLDFFKQVVELQKHYANSRPFSNALQTHGLLLDESWANFLREENFLVGFSIDGPKAIHDAYRRDHRGHGTWDRAIEKIALLLDNRVQVNALATVTDVSVNYPTELYHFFKEIGLVFMQFSPVVEPDKDHLGQIASYSVDPRQYGYFLEQLFLAWLQDFDFKRLKQATSIRFFDSILQRFLGMQPDHCVMLENCHTYVVVEHTGDIYSCDFLVSETTKLGHLNQEGLLAAFNSQKHTDFGQWKAAYDDECRACSWLSFCHGGCIKDRLYISGQESKNRFCESYRYFFPKVEKDFKQLVELYNKHYR